MPKPSLPAPEPGTRFGRGKVLREIKLTASGRSTRGLEMICDCGTQYQAILANVLAERTRSCGCLRREMVAAKNRTPEALARPRPGTPTHGLRHHPLYATWSNVRRRCYDPRDKSYRWYGARGIELCRQWHDVQRFITDIEAEIGPKPPGMTLDRRDNNRNYEPGNVRWATQQEQVRNSRRCLPEGGGGITKHPLYQRWSAMLNVCENPGDKDYPVYGGRGIRVCAEWHDSKAFVAWVEDNLGLPGDPALCLGRPDVNGNYEPGNLRWMTRKEVRQAQRAMLRVAARASGVAG